MIDIPKKPPILLSGLALVCIALGIVVTPELLIELGPGRRALTLHGPLAEQTARLEVTAFRGLCFVAAVVLFGISIWWRRLVASAILKPLWVISGHKLGPPFTSAFGCKDAMRPKDAVSDIQCPLSGVKRTLWQAPQNVCLKPEADIRHSAESSP